MTDPVLAGRGGLSRALSLFGAVALSWSVIAQYVRGDTPLWALVGTLVAHVGWVLLIVLPVPGRALPWLCMAAMVVGGGLGATATSGSAIVAAGVAVLWLTRNVAVPMWRGLALGVVAALLVVAGDALVPVTPLGLIALEAGLAVAFLGGLSRRQFLLADRRSRELAHEQARSDVLSARQELAHDIHDVLAHSLGGLVIQLDAVDALLESGDTGAAAAKVRDARELAAEGLTEARRAVAALREGPADRTAGVSGDRVALEVEALVDAHRSFEGRAELEEVGARHEVSAQVEVALRRAVQEGLTNARKHAPGAAVNVRLAWSRDGIEATISNPLRAGGPASGGGHGLLGMRERFATLPGGAVESGIESGRFVVRVGAKTA
jgi:signal transduction histidine kinase